LFLKSHKHIEFLWISDRLAMVIPLAASFVRLGNFFNSEIIGKPSSSSLAVVFERVDRIPRHPAQLYEFISYIFIFIILNLIYRKYRENTPKGLLISLFLILLFMARFTIEFSKEIQSPFEATLPLNMGQILSLPFIIFGIVLLYISVTKNKKNIKN
ncbi:MAG: phosphatidylglycerol---prolipoprotein diacylglyceryl transferase, partial [Bacteroidota bacterium]|nr:phosphatidylglycerol---prolipoprotein diacylglyceryl transferase [Bacteroidota bacterium]